MDLSKAFDFLNHDLLLSKLHAYGFSAGAIRTIRSYLKNRWQRTKINTYFSEWSELLLCVPQGSVLGPLLLNIYINDVFWYTDRTDICNFADDNTFNACARDLKVLIEWLEHDAYQAIQWFKANYMKLNESKCHLVIPGHKFEHIFAMIGSEKILETQREKLLGFDIDNKLKLK